MNKPRALRPGDTIAVISPSSPIDQERLERGLDVVRSWGYHTKLFPHVLDEAGFLAGSDADRAHDLTAAFEDPDCAAVLCARGGYGAARLLPYLDFPRLAATGKMFMGFSDITTLHLALNQCGLVTFHTPMALTLAYDRVPWVYESMRAMLTGEANPPAAATLGECITPGLVEGDTTGGCVILLTDSIGTEYPLDAKGKILFLEDVGEMPHRVDAMFTQLLNIGALQSAAGIVVGEMTGTDEKEDPTMGGKPWRDIVVERLQTAGVPAIINYPFGHMKTMLSVPMGIRARLDADAGTVTYLESPVSS
ncbi:MAG: LD-carboxypeptidase [Chthonomonas sp.]|nr:LD-carboxypeptidase [Chthonomonas sp.]